VRWFPLALVACAGCDVIFGLQQKAEDVPIDAPGGDAPQSLTCAMPLLDEPFATATEPCKPWGGASLTAAQLSIMADALVVKLAPNQTTFGGCTHASITPFGPGGVELLVTKVVDNPAAYVVFHAYPSDTDAVDAAIFYKGSQLQLLAGGATIMTVSYDAVAMQWWRLRPDPAGTGVIGEYSADGVKYQLLGTVPGNQPAAVKVDFGAGSDPLDGVPEAAFGHLRICSG